MKRCHLIVVLAASLLLTGCYPFRSVGLLQERDNLPQYEKAEYKPYRIHVNDEVVYRLITMDETISKVMTRGQTNNGNDVNSYRVFSDGTIDIPFLEPVRVEGLTIEEARQTLEKAFKEIIPDA